MSSTSCALKCRAAKILKTTFMLTNKVTAWLLPEPVDPRCLILPHREQQLPSIMGNCLSCLVRVFPRSRIEPLIITFYDTIFLSVVSFFLYL